ncbi:MAG: hypothetical protein AAF645_18630, partial [Myxococcota bacterium]
MRHDDRHEPMRSRHRSRPLLPIAAALSLLFVGSSIAQPRVEFHSERGGQFSATQFAAMENGDTLLSFRYRGSFPLRGASLPHASDLGVALAQVAPSGDVRWVRDLKAELPRIQQVASIHPMGDAIVLNVLQSSPTLGHVAHGALVRLQPGAPPRVIFADPSPQATQSWFSVAPRDDGDLVVFAQFREGTFATPGGERFSYEQRFQDDVGQVLLRMDGRTGAVRWSARAPDALHVDAYASGDRHVFVAAKHPNQGSPLSRPTELLALRASDGHVERRVRHAG